MQDLYCTYTYTTSWGISVAKRLSCHLGLHCGSNIISATNSHGGLSQPILSHLYCNVGININLTGLQPYRVVAQIIYVNHTGRLTKVVTLDGRLLRSPTNLVHIFIPGSNRNGAGEEIGSRSIGE